MKKITLVLTFAAAMCLNAFALGHGHGSKPTTTGLEHADATANINAQKGIDNAEEKQAEHKKLKSNKKPSRKHHSKTQHGNAK